MRRATGLIYKSEIDILLDLSLMMLSSIKLIIFIYVKTLIMLILISEQDRGHHFGDPWFGAKRIDLNDLIR